MLADGRAAVVACVIAARPAPGGLFAWDQGVSARIRCFALRITRTGAAIAPSAAPLPPTTRAQARRNAAPQRAVGPLAPLHMPTLAMASAGEHEGRKLLSACSWPACRLAACARPNMCKRTSQDGVGGSQSISTPLPSAAPAIPRAAAPGADDAGPSAGPCAACLDPCVPTLPTPRSEEHACCQLGSSDSRSSLVTAAESETVAGISPHPHAGLQAALEELNARLPLSGECRLRLWQWVLATLPAAG